MIYKLNLLMDIMKAKSFDPFSTEGFPWANKIARC